MQPAILAAHAMHFPLRHLVALLAAILVALFAACLALPAQADEPRHDPAQIRLQVEHFLKVQSTGLPGEVSISVGQIDNRMSLPMCAVPETFLPNGARLW